MAENDLLTFAVLTVSDRCFAKTAEDTSGPALEKSIEAGSLVKNAKVVWTGVVADDQSMIQVMVKHCCDALGVNVMLTTGGTGLAPRDVTPEATQGLMDRLVPGLASVILMEGLKKTSFAALSRGLVGVRKNTLLVNLPGSKKGALEGLEAIASTLAHAVHLILDQKPQVASTHSQISPSKPQSKVVVNTDEATRTRQSTYPMVPMTDLHGILKKMVSSLGAEVVHSTEAVGRVLAEAVVALENIPQAETSMKDGYAIAFHPIYDKPANATIYTLCEASVIGECTPGQKFTGALGPNQAVKISTGSAVPKGTLYVIPVEETSVKSGSVINIKKAARAEGSDIRSIGSDVCCGQVVAEKGALIGESELGVLASIGKAEVMVVRKPVVALLSSGDELQEPWGKLKENGVRDSNKIVLKSLLQSWGYRAIDLGIVRDEPNAVLESLVAGFDAADVVISTGGMSMGERDLLKQVLVTDLGATIHFGRLSMKPGKPTGFATVNYNGQIKHWFGLPGNPASAFVTAHLVVLPALRLLSGWTSHIYLNKILVKLGEEVVKDKERIEYQRGVLTFVDDKGEPLAMPVVHTTGRAAQRSSSIQGCSRANCLLEIPAGDGVILKDLTVTAFLLK